MDAIVPEYIFLASDERIFHELQAVLSPIMFNSCQIIHLPPIPSVSFWACFNFGIHNIWSPECNYANLTPQTQYSINHYWTLQRSGVKQGKDRDTKRERRERREETDWCSLLLKQTNKKPPT